MQQKNRLISEAVQNINERSEKCRAFYNFFSALEMSGIPRPYLDSRQIQWFALKGKRIILLTDKCCFGNWFKKAVEIKKVLAVSRLLASMLVESLPIPDGGDLADWLPDNAIIPIQGPQ